MNLRTRAFLSLTSIQLFLSYSFTIPTNPSSLFSPLSHKLYKALDFTSHTPPPFFPHCTNIMGLFVNPPFVLFSLVDLPVEVYTLPGDISLQPKANLTYFQTLNSILQQAHDGSTVDQWWFYLPSSTDYSVI